MSERKDIHNSEVPALCRACEARHRGVCGALSAEQLVVLNKHATRRVLEPGESLLADSSELVTYGAVLSGVMKLTKTLSDGRQQIVGLQFAPDFVGRPFRPESAIDAESATDVKICAFPKTVIDRMIADSPELEHRLLHQALNELDEAREWMVTLGRKTASEKVASFLWLIATHSDPDRASENGASVFDLPLTRSDIADFLGLTIETVSRQLTKLRKDGVIQIENNRHVTVPDIARLAHRASI